MALILCGHQRSGTTLLRTVCDLHPDITVTMEFGNFLELGSPYKIYRRKLLKRWWNIKNSWTIDSTSNARLKLPALRNFVFMRRYLHRLHRLRTNPVEVKSIDEALWSLFPTSRIIGDKWPSYIYLLDDLVEMEGLSCVVIYRDCLDATSSTLRKARTDWAHQPWVKWLDTAEKVAERWLRAVEIMERHTGKLYAIRYEDLVQQPEQELEKLGQWMGVDSKGFPAHIIKDTSVGSYKKGLSDQEIKEIITIAGATMERLGYDF